MPRTCRSSRSRSSGASRELGELVATALERHPPPHGHRPGRNRKDARRSPGRRRARRNAARWRVLGAARRALRPGALLTSELAQTIGARDDLAAFVRDKELLLLLDNFEHLLDAAPAVARLLASSTSLRVLVTSRAPLRVSGEREYRLEPLPAGDASALFVERARAVGKELAPDSTVESICRRLDGLPLAIELAAARTKLLGVEVLLERLDSALPLLTGGARDAPERQRTLRATIEWSYDLLDAASRQPFARLAVFAGSFQLAAAEEVCDAELDALAALVDLSLLKPVGDDRFVLLETIREYAHEKLDESGEADDLGRRHAEFFRRLAEEAYAHRFDAEAESAARLETDHDDLRAALDWLAAHDVDRSARARRCAGLVLAFSRPHGGGARAVFRTRSRLSSSRGHERARALTALGALTARHGDVASGRIQLEEAMALWHELGDRDELASALDALGWPLIYDAGDDAGALAAFEQSLELRRELGDSAGETRALVGVCQVLVALGDVDRAEPLSREILERAGDDTRTEHFGYHFLADCALIRGDAVEAEKRYRQSLEAALPLGDVIETSFEVQGVAMAVAGNGDPERGVRLAASVEALWESFGITISIPFWDALLERYLGPAREELGERAGEILAEGRAMPFDDAVELALGS